MATLFAACHEYLDLDCRWWDEPHDRTGSYAVPGEHICSKKVYPVILKAFTDLRFEENLSQLSHHQCFGVARRLQESFGGLSGRPGEWKRVSLKQACALLKNRRLAARLQAKGGTCMTLDETDIGFYLLLWIGVPLKQVWDSINATSGSSYKLNPTATKRGGR